MTLAEAFDRGIPLIRNQPIDTPLPSIWCACGRVKALATDKVCERCWRLATMFRGEPTYQDEPMPPKPLDDADGFHAYEVGEPLFYCGLCGASKRYPSQVCTECDATPVME